VLQHYTYLKLQTKWILPPGPYFSQRLNAEQPSNGRAESGMKDRFVGVVRRLVPMRRKKISEQGEQKHGNQRFRHTSA
jgi:hypothetical protein